MDSQLNSRAAKNRLRVNGGRLVAYLQTQKEEEVTVRASSPFLQSAELTFVSR
jgi:hypothetical protein